MSKECKHLCASTVCSTEPCFTFYPRPQIRTVLEQHMSCNLKEYKEFIDNEMLLILGQMDKATLVFDYLYLVRTSFFVTFTFICSDTCHYLQLNAIMNLCNVSDALAGL